MAERRTMQDSALRFLYSRTAASFGVRVVGVGGMFLAMLLLARTLGKEQFGLYAYIVDLVALAAVAAGFGFNQIAVRVVPDAIARAERGKLARYATWGAALTLLSALLLWPLLAMAEREGILPAGLTGALVPLAAGLLGAVGILRLAQEMLRGARRIVLSQLVEQVFWPALALTLAGLMLAGVLPRLAGVIISAQIMLLVVSAVILFALFFRPLAARDDLSGPAEGPRQWSEMGLPLAMAGLLSVFLARGDMIVLGASVSAQSLAPYAASARIAGLLIFALGAANATTAPMMREYWSAGDHDALQRLADRSAALATLAALPIAFVAFLFPGTVLQAFGPGYDHAAPVLRLLAFGQLFNALTGPVGPLMVAAGRQGAYSVHVAVTAGLHAIALVLLIPEFGLSGAALSTAGSAVLLNSALAVFIYRKLGIVSHARPAGLLRTMVELAGYGRRFLSRPRHAKQHRDG